jgi:hypothetical protein
MGIAFILIGLLAAGVVVDFVIENDLAGAPDRAFALFGGSFTLNETEVALGAAVLGGFAVLFVVLGFALFRDSWGRRRDVKHRVVELERENAELRSTPRVVTMPEAERRDEVRADREVETDEERRRREALAESEADREHARNP